MKGAIIGDIIGSTYEFNPTKDYNFELFAKGMTFTDDTVLTIAVTDSILNNITYDKTIYDWGNRYTGRGYGFRFSKWLANPNPQPYNSFGNGSAMRVSPVGLAYPTISKVLKHAELSAVCSHNHPEGIKGAQAVALAIHLACQGHDKTTIKLEIEERIGYDLSESYQSIHDRYDFDETCQGSVPEALIAFFESTDFESAIRLTVSLGGDADTQAAMAGAIAEAYYKEIPEKFIQTCMPRLTEEMSTLLDKLYKKYPLKKSTLVDRMEMEGIG